MGLTESTSQPTDASEAWPRCPQAAAFFQQTFDDFARENPLVAELANRFRTLAGVDIHTLVDHWILPPTPGLTEQLTRLGLSEITLPEGDVVWRHPEARLPQIRIKSKRTTPVLSLRVDDIERFALANGLNVHACHGDPDAAYQCGHVTLPVGELMPIARRGYDGFAPQSLNDDEREHLRAARAAFQHRDRSGSEMEVFARTGTLVRSLVSMIGRDRATEEFFAAERDYWLTRNRAAQWQYARQQQIGIGWANQDHHTYRSSRAGFRSLMGLWQDFGFVTRERFYAGAEAGWGAQIVEHPVCRLILFCDVDMTPDELNIAFVNTDLPALDTLGTIGLWCALHTSSIAESGMHHLEAEYDYAQVQANLEAAGYEVMSPFTDLPVLKQAFTQPELWPVPSARLEHLVADGSITAEQAARFTTVGAPGSHLEILQRWEGFKGFNKTGVSAIIRETDARNPR